MSPRWLRRRRPAVVAQVAHLVVVQQRAAAVHRPRRVLRLP